MVEYPFPALVELGLTQSELNALKNQGFVATETRRSGCRYYKLRFRKGRKQVVHYVGSDPDRAARIERELEILQREHRVDQDLRRRVRAARRALRESKRALTPVLQAMGYHYHGFAIRRSRIPTPRPWRRSIQTELQIKEIEDDQRRLDDRC